MKGQQGRRGGERGGGEKGEKQKYLETQLTGKKDA
jgi:hypothetical protein